MRLALCGTILAFVVALFGMKALCASMIVDSHPRESPGSASPRTELKTSTANDMEVAEQERGWQMQELGWVRSPAFGKGEYNGVISPNPKWLPPAGRPNTPSNSSRSSAAKPPPIADTVDGRMFYQADYWDWVAKENAKRNDSPQSAGRPMPADRPKQGKKAKNVPAQAKRRKTAPSASAKKGKKARQPH